MTVSLAITMAPAAAVQPPPPVTRQPLEVARALAARYPAQPIMSYIPALAWSGSLRLAALTGEERWREKPRREMQVFLDGRTAAIAEPYLLTSLAGHLAFADLGSLDGNAAAAALALKAAELILPRDQDETIRFPRRWTDDMFMASSLLSRVAARTRDARFADAVGRLLLSYAAALQRGDGLFVHATEGPHAWGRGNGFAVLGLADALTYLPESWPDRARVLEIYRRHLRAMLEHQSDDGSWRQVVDEPASYRELTVTAMTVAAIARGLRSGWLDRAAFQAALDRGWQAVLARVGDDGAVRDVCSGTGAGPTKEYYLNRPVVNGPDDRGGAMALLAALEVETLARARR
jgi:rhamnogalacturonyl hydrolase YesR